MPVGVLVFGARAELDARRYRRARSLLVGQPWLDTDGHGLALLGEAEAGLGLHASAAERFAAARSHVAGPLAALFAVRRALALAAAGHADDAAASLREARRLGLGAIADWLRLREAGLTRDTAAARTLLTDLGPGPSREAPRAWAGALLAAGDTAAARAAYTRLGARGDAVRLALSQRDTAAARSTLYADARHRAPAADHAALIRDLAAAVPPRTAPEFVALARAHLAAAAPRDGVAAVERALALGDSSGATLLLAGELRTAAGQSWLAEHAYRAASADPAVAPLAAYRRARVLLRLDAAGAERALAGFADAYPADSAAPTAMFLLADHLAERDTATGVRWYAELIRRHPIDPRSSLARFRLAAAAERAGRPDSAATLLADEIARGAPQALAARFWLGRLAAAGGDSAAARRLWSAVAVEDSFGYYGLRARVAAGMPLPVVPLPPPGPTPATAAAALARIDTLRLAGLDSESVAEVRVLTSTPPADLDAVLALSVGLATRGFGPAGVRLGWVALGRAPGDPRAVRAVFPWPNREAVTAEAAEFDVDALVFAGLVRQESVFDAAALSGAGARGLAQLLPATATQVARHLEVPFEADWLVVPDLNLHLGAAHLARLLRRYDGRIDAALAAYNAGTRPVDAWLRRPGADDPDAFLEAIPYRETRGYVRAVLRNRWLYAALYPAPSS